MKLININLVWVWLCATVMPHSQKKFPLLSWMQLHKLDRLPQPKSYCHSIAFLFIIQKLIWPRWKSLFRTLHHDQQPLQSIYVLNHVWWFWFDFVQVMLMLIICAHSNCFHSSLYTFFFNSVWWTCFWNFLVQQYK